MAAFGSETADSGSYVGGMYFWLIVLLALAIGVLCFVGGAPVYDGGFGMTYLAAFGFGMVIAGVIRLLFSGGKARFSQLLSWTAAIGLVLTLFNYRLELQDLYDRVTGEHVPKVAMTRTGGEAELRRAWDGHYRADARVNGVDMRLLVDTGASMVLLPYEEVKRLGVDRDELQYTLPVMTANGRSSVAPIRIGSITIGDIEVTNVSAAVAQPGALRIGLLGMSFLDQLSETVFQGDRLVLRQKGVSGTLENSRFMRVPDAPGDTLSTDVEDRPKPD